MSGWGQYPESAYGQQQGGHQLGFGAQGQQQVSTHACKLFYINTIVTPVQMLFQGAQAHLWRPTSSRSLALVRHKLVVWCTLAMLHACIAPMSDDQRFA